MKLILLLLLCLPLVACEAFDPVNQMTPQEHVEFDAAANEADQAREAVMALEESAKQLLDEVAMARDHSTVTELYSRLEVVLQNFEIQRRRIEDATARQSVVLQAASERTPIGPLDRFLPFVPEPLRAPAALVTTLLPWLLSDRGREHAKKVLASTGRLQLGDALTSLLRMFGTKHTTEDPIELAEALKTVALKKGESGIAAGVDAMLGREKPGAVS